MADSHTRLVKLGIPREPAFHVILTRDDQCILAIEVVKPKVADILKKNRGEGLLELGGYGGHDDWSGVKCSFQECSWRLTESRFHG